MGVPQGVKEAYTPPGYTTGCTWEAYTTRVYHRGYMGGIHHPGIPQGVYGRQEALGSLLLLLFPVRKALGSLF